MSQNHLGTTSTSGSGTSSVPVDQHKHGSGTSRNPQVVPVPTPGTGTTEPPTGTGSDTGSRNLEPPLSAPYFDIRALLAGELPDPPKPTDPGGKDTPTPAS